MSTQRLDDGFSTIITIANLPNVKLYEKDVTPPGFSGGGPIDTTTMRNSNWRTMAPKSLKSLSALTATVAFATEALNDIQNQLGINQLVIVTFPDNSSLSFYGWIDEFTLGKFTEGEQPTATITIQPSLRHPTTGAETAPDYDTASGSL